MINSKESLNDLLTDMRRHVEYSDKITMPIPLYERMKAVIVEQADTNVGQIKQPTELSSTLIGKLESRKRTPMASGQDEAFNSGLCTAISIILQHEAQTSEIPSGTLIQRMETLKRDIKTSQQDSLQIMAFAARNDAIEECINLLRGGEK